MSGASVAVREHDNTIVTGRKGFFDFISVGNGGINSAGPINGDDQGQVGGTAPVWVKDWNKTGSIVSDAFGITPPTAVDNMYKLDRAPPESGSPISAFVEVVVSWTATEFDAADSDAYIEFPIANYGGASAVDIQSGTVSVGSGSVRFTVPDPVIIPAIVTISASNVDRFRVSLVIPSGPFSENPYTVSATATIPILLPVTP